MKPLLREPLFHFLLLGAAIFVAYGHLSKGGANQPRSIVITQGMVESLATSFATTWQRPPTAEELSGLIRDRVREEVYYREALALGLEKDDTVIRRRLRQKMEFVSEDIAAQTEPTEAELQAFLQAHVDQFRCEPRFTFRQVYLDPRKHGEELLGDAAQLLTELLQGGDTVDAPRGDASMLEPAFTAMSSREVANQFGPNFAAALGGLEPGQWQGLVESAYGMHLVKISERTEARLPPLAEVREAVLREWANAHRLETNERFYQELEKRYAVTVELPPTVPEGIKVAGTQ